MEKEAAILKKYLLGALKETEEEEVGLQIIEGAFTDDDLRLAEESLIEDYLEKTLSSEENKLFETNFLITDERRGRVEFLLSVKNYASQRPALEADDESRRGAEETLFRKLNRFFHFAKSPVPALPLIILVAVIAVVLLIFNRSNTGNVNSFNKDVAALNARDLRDLAEFRNLTHIPLISGTLRGDASTNRIAVERLSEVVLLRLVLMPGVYTNSSFNVEFAGDEKVLFTLNDLRAYENAAGKELRLLLPAKMLRPGNYRIKLTTEDEPDKPIVYQLLVQ